VTPRDYVTEWRANAPWIEDAQVEQDLVISKALVDIFSHPLLQNALAFHGGTGDPEKPTVPSIRLVQLDRASTATSASTAKLATLQKSR
jgi:hypothetical protein